LNDYELLEPETIRMRAKFWAAFNNWLDSELGVGSLDILLRSPIALVKALEAYGHHQYAVGVPLHYYRQLLAHTQKEFPLVRPYMVSPGRWSPAGSSQSLFSTGLQLLNPWFVQWLHYPLLGVGRMWPQSYWWDSTGFSGSERYFLLDVCIC